MKTWIAIVALAVVGTLGLMRITPSLSKAQARGGIERLLQIKEREAKMRVIMGEPRIGTLHKNGTVDWSRSCRSKKAPARGFDCVTTRY